VLREEEELALKNVKGDASSVLIPLSVADPRWKMPKDAMYALVQYYSESPDATRYTDNSGAKKCKKAGMLHSTHERIARYLRRRFQYGDRTGRELITNVHVQYSPGSIKRLLAEYIPATLFDENTLVIFPTPGYGVITSDMNTRGATVSSVPLVQNGFRWDYDFDRIDVLVRDWNGKIGLPSKIFMYVNVPHNPTGFGYSYSLWKQLLTFAEKQGIILLVDEAYIDLIYENLEDVRPPISVLSMPGWAENCIVFQSVSKGYSATGLRFGWVVGAPTIIAAIAKVMDVKDSGMFGPSIATGLECLDRPAWAEQTRDDYYVLHQMLADGLVAAGFYTRVPDAGLCQLTRAPKKATVNKPVDATGLSVLYGEAVTFTTAAECAKWMREVLRISVMHYDVEGVPYLRWAITVGPMPEYKLETEADVIFEAMRRLGNVTFEF
jgi:aspartate/methionine/tyrosine aminotransferase